MKIGNFRLVGDMKSVTVSETGGKPLAPPEPDKPVDKKSTPEYKDGYQDGFRDRDQKAAAELAALRQKLDAAANVLPAALSAYFQELEGQALGEVVDVAFEVARIILQRELSTDPDATARVIHQALGPVVGHDHIRVKLSPEFLKLVAAGSAEALPSNIQTMADPALGFGEAMVECPQGIIDATLGTRLTSLRQAVDSAFAQPADPAASGEAAG